MNMVFSTDQIIGGLVGLGLVLRGILDWYARNSKPKAAERGCLFGDAAHEKIEDLVTAKCDKIKENQVKIITILEERKRGDF